MNNKTKSIRLAALAAAGLMLSGCGGTTSDSATLSSDDYENPGDVLGGGGEVDSTPTETDPETSGITDVVSSDEEISDGVPEDAVLISEELGNLELEEAGNYYATGEIGDQIEITADGVHLYLEDATVTNGKKVIKSDDYGVTITLIGENSIYNTNTSDPKDAIDVGGTLVLNGSGSLDIVSQKHGISANAISISGCSLNIESEKDGLHAEILAYDGLTSEPTPSYDDGGYVYIDGASLDIESADDGIQADTFAYLTGGSQIAILAGGGAPATVTETSSDNASGKGIKVGLIDWEDEDGIAYDIEWDGYCLWIDDATVDIDSNDDALHSNYEMLVDGGTLSLSSGDDAMHADELMKITDGNIDITKCYEGIEAAKVEISGGYIEVESYEDGVNAADGTDTTYQQGYNENCHIIISGGYLSVNCIGSEGDGIDSNGTMLISGGELYIAGSSSNSDAALDSDGGILVNGGYLFAAGQLGMVETPASNSGQYVVSYARNQSISAGTYLYLTDSEGEIIMYFVTPRSCQSLILSCPEFERGESYSIYAGDSVLSTFTISSTITTVGSSSNINDPTGNPGGGGPGGNTPGFGGGSGGRR